MKIKIKKFHPEAKIPSYAHIGDAGMDLYSIEDKTINPGERISVGTGIGMEYENGFCTVIWDKSGLAINNGLKTIGGLVEPNYRGEYKVLLLNTSDKEYKIKKGQKIAQLVILPVIYAEVEEVEELSESERKGGFGSTGV